MKIKKTFAITFFSVVLITTSLSYAADLKVGFVNLGSILQDSTAGQAADKKLKKEFKPRMDKLKSMNDKIKKLDKKLKTEGDVMSSAEKKKNARQITKLQRDFDRARTEANEDFQIRRNEVLGKLQKKASTVIMKIAKEQKFDLILPKASIIYASKRIDITQQVLKQLK